MTQTRRFALLLTAVAAFAPPAFASAFSTPAASTSDPLRVVDSARRLEDRIVNGVLESTLPAVAAVRDEIGTLCTGTLIGCRTVLTAANCFCHDPATGQELNGTQCRTRTDLLAPDRFNVFFQNGGYFAVEKIEINPSYVFGEGSDMALVTLTSTADGIAPLPINRLQSPAVDTVGQIAGFGRSTAADDYGLKRSGAVRTTACTTVPADRNVCFKYEEPVGEPGASSNSCNGDAGGPLLVNFGQGQRVAGIISSGENAQCTAPDQSWNTDVYVDRNWIEATAGNDVTATSCGSLPQVGQDGATVFALSANLPGPQTANSYNFQVPAGTAMLRLAINGTELAGNPDPDFDLYLRLGAAPTPSTYDCKSDSAGLFEYCEIQNPDAGTWNVLVTDDQGAGTYQISATLFNTTPSVCTPGETTLCLNGKKDDKRFRVKVDYASLPRQLSGQGKAIALDSVGVSKGGLFWFFGADNPELLVKVLDGCAVNNRFWIYLTAGTDVGYLVTVTDTVTGLSKSYSNPDGNVAEPVQDVNAIACD